MVCSPDELAPRELVGRQMEELAAVGYTGQLVVHMHQGAVTRVYVEGAVIWEGRQKWHIVPAVGHE